MNKILTKLFFKDNTNKSDGTNIYFQNKGQCVQNKCCCISCYGGTYGIHSCIKVTQSSESKNYVFQSTFFNMNSPSYGVFVHFYGDFQVNKINITYCHDNYYSCFDVMDPNSAVLISTSNFKNNTSGVSGISISNADRYTASITRCNIIKLYCKSEGIIKVTCYTRIDTCVIKDNFANDKYLFC